ncbi:hypothetical protein Tco_1123867 [Tanacetum coccineum]|uniref:Uncharacterized protein n=1 Tax=Tanacetum coccineum TaxID=301880 RepID=A0ABQ5J4I3_9ASTR
MTTTKQGMSFAEVEQIIAQRVANAIETIAIYETKTRMARESTNQIKHPNGRSENGQPLQSTLTSLDKDSEVAQRATYFWFRIHVRFSKGQAACSAELLFTKWTSLSLIKYYKERPLTSEMKQRKWLPTEPQMIIKRVSTGSTRVALGITSKARRRIMIGSLHTRGLIMDSLSTYQRVEGKF